MRETLRNEATAVDASQLQRARNAISFPLNPSIDFEVKRWPAERVLALQRTAGNMATVCALKGLTPFKNGLKRIQRIEGQVVGPDPGSFTIGDRVTILETRNQFHRVKRSRDDLTGWISINCVKLDEGGASSTKGTVDQLLFKLAAAAEFIRKEGKSTYEELVAGGKEPTSLIELKSFADLANKVYALFDHKIAEEQEAESMVAYAGKIPQDKSYLHNALEARQEVEAYRSKLAMWTLETQSAVYALRDTLLTIRPDDLPMFSLNAQYSEKFPGQAVPPVLNEVDSTLGTVIFSSQVENDCGRFANRLFEERSRQAINAYLTHRGGESKRFTKEDFDELLKKPGLEDVKKATLRYKEDPKFPYPHHAKTSVGSHEGKLFALEAHKGKPFLLAPELQIYGSHAEFIESEDEYIATREESDLPSYLGRLLAPERSDFSESARFELAKREKGGLGEKPLGKRGADYRKEEQPSPGTSTQMGSLAKSDEEEGWIQDLRLCGVNDVGVCEKCLIALRLVKEEKGDFNSWDVLAEWCNSPDAFTSEFSREKFHKWSGLNARARKEKEKEKGKGKGKGKEKAVI